MAKRVARPVLTDKQRRELRDLQRSAQSIDEFRRAQSICLHAGGWDVEDTAEALDVTPAAVYGWLKRWQRCPRADRLRDQPRSGRPRKYSTAFRRRVSRTVERSPKRFHLVYSVWSILTLAAYLFVKTNTDVSRTHLRRILHEEGFVWRRPKLTLRHRQRRGVYRTVRKRLISLEKQARRPGSEFMLLYADEAEFHLNPGLTGMWTRIGKQQEIPSAGQNRKIAVFGGIDVASGRMEWHLCARKNQKEFLQFLTTVMETFPKKRLILVLDNVKYHKTAAVRQFVENTRGRLEILWLPPYSPNLNKIERVWKHLKSRYLYNEFFGTLENMVRAVEYALEDLNMHLTMTRAFLAASQRKSRAA